MNIVIIGGVAAGAKAAAKIKRLLPSAKVQIYTDDTHVSYSSCGIPYYVEGNFTDYRMLLVRSPEEFKKDGIDVFLETRVEKILPAQKKILVSHSSQARLVEYDKLIIATGARPKIPDIKGVNDFDNIYTVRKIEDAINIRERVLSSKRAVIVGGGYIGLEMLEALVKNGLHVDLIEHRNYLMHNLDDEMSNLLQDRLHGHSEYDFEIVTNDSVVEFCGQNRVLKSVTTESNKKLYTDFVILCVGVLPNTQLAKDAGIEIGETGAIKVNKIMRTSEEDIYACGDCAEKIHIVSGKPVWIPLGSTANKEGRCAAMNAAGIYAEFEGVLGSTVSRCISTTIASTGLTEREAKNIGFTPVSVIINKPDKVSYMPDASDITLKVIADKITGLLLGAQAVGSIGADKRINTITSALLGHLTAQEFNNNDITYSPPYSTTIDPLLNAMQILCTKTARDC